MTLDRAALAAGRSRTPSFSLHSALHRFALHSAPWLHDHIGQSPHRSSAPSPVRAGLLHNVAYMLNGVAGALTGGST